MFPSINAMRFRSNPLSFGWFKNASHENHYNMKKNIVNQYFSLTTLFFMILWFSGENRTMDVSHNIAAGKYKNKLSYAGPKQREIFEKYHAESRRLDGLFRSDLEAEHGLVGHSKADLLFRLAWAAGHASGYSDVEYHYSTMAELLK
jgi:hypothetical protein